MPFHQHCSISLPTLLACLCSTYLRNWSWHGTQQQQPPPLQRLAVRAPWLSGSAPPCTASPNALFGAALERCALLLHHRRHAYVASRAWWCRPFGSLFQLSQCFSRRVFLFPLLTSTELLAHGRTSNIGFGVRVLIPCNWRVLLAISHERFSTSICPPARKTEPIEPTAARAHKRNTLARQGILKN